MSKDEPDTLPKMMDELRKLQRQLEKLMADAVTNFEEASGLTVEDVKLIRVIDSTIGSSNSLSRVGSVKLTIRL